LTVCTGDSWQIPSRHKSAPQQSSPPAVAQGAPVSPQQTLPSVVVPQLGESIAEATIVSYLVQPGDDVAAESGRQAEHPFEVGDWIHFDDAPEHIGKVLEINWRATKLVTLENVLVVVPNGVLAKTPLANYNKPTRPAMRSVEVIAPTHVPPQQVHRVLLAAVRGAEHGFDFRRREDVELPLHALAVGRERVCRGSRVFRGGPQRDGSERLSRVAEIQTGEVNGEFHEGLAILRIQRHAAG